jgi:serine/threonine protein kinase/HAMP domain-containing protein
LGDPKDNAEKTVVDTVMQARLRAAMTEDSERTVIDTTGAAERSRAGRTQAERTLVEAAAEPGMAEAAANEPRRALPPKPAAPSNVLPIGFRLHEYRIDGILGQGGFGIAYAATDVNLNAKVVIKEYLPEDFAYRTVDNTVSARADDDQGFYQTGLDNFLVEARTLATFRHPHIVRVARFFEAHKTAYMVLEYERGQSLKVWRKKRVTVSEQQIVSLFAPLFDGLAVVHRAGYLHRDIKPDNIYVRDDDGTLVLLDFGAARQTTSQSADTGAVVTPGYGPIEQYAGGGRQGPWTDIYAMGATLFWIVTGKKPIEAPERLAEEDPLPSAEVLAKGKYSDEFLRAIDWALKVHPKDRPQDMNQFRAALFASAGELGLQDALLASDEEYSQPLKDSWVSTVRSPRSMKGRLANAWRAVARPASWPIAVKMTLAMVATALLPMVITAYFNLNATLDKVAASELRNLEQLSQSTAGRIAQLIGDSRNLANYLGTDDDFVQFLQKPPTDAGKEALRQKLVGLIKANPDVQLAMVFNTSGDALVSSDPQVMGRNFKFREYFKIAMEGRPFMTGIVVGSVAGAAGVFYSQPVFSTDGKTVIGAVVLRILADPINRIMIGAQIGNDRVPFLVDEDGVIVMHPNDKVLYASLAPLKKEAFEEIIADQRFRRKTIENVNQPDLAKAMVGNKQGGTITYNSNINKREEIAGFSPVPGTGWSVAVSESRDYFAEPLNRLFYNVLLSVVLVGAVFVLLAMLFARSIVKPIEKLTSAAHALKSGDYANANIAVRSNDEVGQLARTFNVMIDVLRQRERERSGRRAALGYEKED